MNVPPTTLRNTDLEHLVKVLRVQKDFKRDAVVPSHGISVNRDGLLEVAGMGSDGSAGKPGTFVLSDVFLDGIADKMKIPLPYLRRLKDTRPDLFAATINGMFNGNYGKADGWTVKDPADVAEVLADRRKFYLRTFLAPDGTPGYARALLANNFRAIDNLDVLTAAFAGVSKTGVEAEVDTVQLTERRMTVNVVCPAVTTVARKLLDGYRSPFTAGEKRAGDWDVSRARQVAIGEGSAIRQGNEPIVWAGFQFTNSETGGGAFNLAPRIIFTPCSNGLKIAGDLVRRVHVGARMEEGLVEWSDETREKNLELVTSMTADAVASWLTPGYIEKIVADLEDADAPLTDPAKTIKHVGNTLGFSADVTEGVLRHFYRSGQSTTGGVLQAVTSFAQTVDNVQVAADLEDHALEAFITAAAYELALT